MSDLNKESIFFKTRKLWIPVFGAITLCTVPSYADDAAPSSCCACNTEYFGDQEYFGDSEYFADKEYFGCGEYFSDDSYDDGYDDGYNDGYSNGYTDGYADGSATLPSGSDSNQPEPPATPADPETPAAPVDPVVPETSSDSQSSAPVDPVVPATSGDSQSPAVPAVTDSDSSTAVSADQTTVPANTDSDSSAKGKMIKAKGKAKAKAARKSRDATTLALGGGVSADQVNSCGKFIVDSLHGKFHLADVPNVMHQASQFLATLGDLPPEAKRQAVIGVAYYVIDNTDTPWVPDTIYDPIIKSVIPTFADVFLSDSLLTSLHFNIPAQMVTEQDIEAVVDLIHQQFADGFQWSDLRFVLAVAFKFGMQLDELSWAESEDVMNKVVDLVLDRTDTPYLPDAISDPIFKSLSHTILHLVASHFEANESAVTPAISS